MFDEKTWENISDFLDAYYIVGDGHLERNPLGGTRERTSGRSKEMGLGIGVVRKSF